MKLLIPFLLLLSTVHASEVDQMAQALRNEGLNDKAVKVLLRHAKLESEYGTKGVAKGTLNWWNCTTTKSYGGKKRVSYEYEHGRMIKKFWYVWDTPEEASKSFIRFLRRRYRGALTEASKGDYGEYMRVLRKGGYFGKV